MQVRLTKNAFGMRAGAKVFLSAVMADAFLRGGRAVTVDKVKNYETKINKQKAQTSKEIG